MSFEVLSEAARRCVPLLGIAGVCATAPAAAEPPTAASDTLPVATLYVWAEDVWLDILDREGTIRGPLATEGIFQRFHALMDPEYTLDIRTGLFTPAEDTRWAHSDSGIRAAASSISHPHILNRLDWRQAFPVSGPVDLIAEYGRDHSLTDRRDHVRIGVRWRGAGGSAWTAWSRIGVHFFKPAADVEVGAARSWLAGNQRKWRLELRIAALDAFSDAIFVGLGVDPREVEAHLDHAGLPLAARAFLERATRSWRVELHAAATTMVRSRVTFPGGGAAPFDLEERVAYAGTLVELAPAPRLSLAAYARVAQAETRRAYGPEASANLLVTERTGAAGGYVRQRLGSALAAVADLHTVSRPETRVGETATIDHEDREVYWTIALVRRPSTGWTGRLGYAGVSRDAGVLLPIRVGAHHRLVTEGGYRTNAGFEVSVGVRWDLDEIDDHPFDGGHLRLSAIPFRTRAR